MHRTFLDNQDRGSETKSCLNLYGGMSALFRERVRECGVLFSSGDKWSADTLLLHLRYYGGWGMRPKMLGPDKTVAP